MRVRGRRACASRRACVCATVGVVRAAVRVGVTASLACRRERTGCCMCVHVTVTVTAAPPPRRRDRVSRRIVACATDGPCVCYTLPCVCVYAAMWVCVPLWVWLRVAATVRAVVCVCVPPGQSVPPYAYRMLTYVRGCRHDRACCLVVHTHRVVVPGNIYIRDCI